MPYLAGVSDKVGTLAQRLTRSTYLSLSDVVQKAGFYFKATARYMLKAQKISSTCKKPGFETLL